MKLGFLTACLPDRSLEEIAAWAAEHRFEALEVAAWPNLGDRPFTATFARGRMSLQLGCNRLNAPYALAGGVMSVGTVAKTRMACAEPDRMMAETRFGMALGSVTVARRASGGIALIDPEGRERIGLISAAGQ